MCILVRRCVATRLGGRSQNAHSENRREDTKSIAAITPCTVPSLCQFCTTGNFDVERSNSHACRMTTDLHQNVPVVADGTPLALRCTLQSGYRQCVREVMLQLRWILRLRLILRRSSNSEVTSTWPNMGHTNLQIEATKIKTPSHKHLHKTSHKRLCDQATNAYIKRL